MRKYRLAATAACCDEVKVLSKFCHERIPLAWRQPLPEKSGEIRDGLGALGGGFREISHLGFLDFP